MQKLVTVLEALFACYHWRLSRIFTIGDGSRVHPSFNANANKRNDFSNPSAHGRD